MARDLDSSYIGPYLKDWLSYIQKSNEAEQQAIKSGKEFRVPYAGAQPKLIRVIFIICNKFQIESHAKHMAVHLLDQYLGCLFWELVTSSGKTDTKKLMDKAIEKAKNEISDQMKLVLAACIQIASKVDLFKTGLSIPQIQDLLESIDSGRIYSSAAIIACELRILYTLDFRIPVSLPIHVLELLLAYTELSHTRETCFHLLDIAYLNHENVFEQLHLLARGKKYDKSRPECRDFLALEANSTFIAASVLICSAHFFNLKKKIVETLGTKLAKLIEISVVDLSFMANVLLTYVIDENEFKALQSGNEVEP